MRGVVDLSDGDGEVFDNSEIECDELAQPTILISTVAINNDFVFLINHAVLFVVS